MCLVIAGFLFILQSFIGGVLALNSSRVFPQASRITGQKLTIASSIKVCPHIVIGASAGQSFGASCAAMVAQLQHQSRLSLWNSQRWVFGDKLSQTNQNSGTPVLAVLSSSSLTLIIAVSAAKE